MAERSCIVTGQTLPREKLIRFVAGPDGFAVADLADKLPGRGVWVSIDPVMLRKAAAKSMLKRSISAEFRDIEADIDLIASLLHKRATDSASLARRAGALLGGAGKLAAEGLFDGLLAAPDASEKECRRLASKLDVNWTSRALTATDLGQICGRESLAFAAVRGGGARGILEKLKTDLDRLEAFSRSSSCQAG